jgi:hypothetical protein
MVANIGAGVKVVATKGNQNMVENSVNSPQNAKRNTKQTVKLTREQALEILQQSIIECQKSGLEMRIVPSFWDGGQQYAAVMVANVAYIGGNLTFVGGSVAMDCHQTEEGKV